MPDQKKITIRFDPDHWRQLKILKIDGKIESIQKLVSDLIDKYLNNPE